MVEQALAKAGAGLGGRQRGEVALVPPQPLDQRIGLGEQGFERRAAAGADEVVGVLAFGQGDEAQRAIGREVGQSAQGSADGGFLPGGIAVEAEDRRRVEPPHPFELRLGHGGAVGGDGLGDAGAVERDDVHIAFDDDQAAGRAAGGGGAIDVVEGAALVEQDGLGGVQVFRLARS